MSNNRILVTGAAGQLGSALTAALRNELGADAVLATDIRKPEKPTTLGKGPFQELDILSRDDLRNVLKNESIATVYHMAAIKSNEAEKRRAAAWNANVNGLYNVLDALKEQENAKLLFPSSIAAFGPDGGDPRCLYGVSKRTGEMMCGFFRNRFGLDTRSLRIPGVLSADFEIGGGGLSDFASEIFKEAAGRKRYGSYLEGDTEFELIHLSDTIDAMRTLMAAPRTNVELEPVYAIRSFAASPNRLAEFIRERIPDFELSFEIDTARQSVADSLPTGIDDSAARADWGYEPAYGLERTAGELLDGALKG